MRVASLIPCLFLLAGTQEKDFRISGPPAIPAGGRVTYRVIIKSLPKGATLIWHFSDSPTWIETEPKMDRNSKTVEGVESVRVKVGTTKGEGRFTVSVVRRGRRLAQRVFRFRVVEPIVLRVRLRPVRHKSGGARLGALLAHPRTRRLWEAAVNSSAMKAGVYFRFESGPAVTAKDSLFDDKGVFHPVTRRHQKRAKSRTLARLYRNDLPGATDIYLVRECHWTERTTHGFVRTQIDYPLQGVGLKMGSVVLDDSAGPQALAHELAHVLALNDLEGPGDRHRLMSWIHKERTATELSYEEMALMRRTATKLIRLHRRGR